MGSPKAELVVDGTRLLDRSIGALAAGGCVPVIAVVRDGVLTPGAHRVVNPHPEDGLRSSLALAVNAADELEADGLVVVLVDMPGIGAEAVAALAAAWTPGRIAIGRYGMRSGHPIVMSVELWQRAIKLAEPDEGARALLAATPELVDEIATVGNAFDIDSPADLREWISRNLRT